jgi:hypothetical protein
MTRGLVDFQANRSNDVDLLVGLDGRLDLVLCDGRVQVAQDMHTRFGTWAREWFLDERAGVRYREDVLVKAPNLAFIEAAFRRLIASTPGVIGLQEFRLVYDRADRRLDLAFVALTPWGNLPAVGESVGASIMLLSFPALGAIVP